MCLQCLCLSFCLFATLGKRMCMRSTRMLMRSTQTFMRSTQMRMSFTTHECSCKAHECSSFRHKLCAGSRIRSVAVSCKYSLPHEPWLKRCVTTFLSGNTQPYRHTSISSLPCISVPTHTCMFAYDCTGIYRRIMVSAHWRTTVPTHQHWVHTRVPTYRRLGIRQSWHACVSASRQMGRDSFWSALPGF